VISRRKFINTVALGLALAPLVAEAQEAGKVCRIGYLGNASAFAQAKRVESLRVALRDLGYEEGKNIPIVMVGIGAAVASGVVTSLARPGGNITGSTDSVPELTAKLLELLKEVRPRTRRVAGEPGALASPVCYAAEVDPGHFGEEKE
jgi:hypothetical protein